MGGRLRMLQGLLVQEGFQVGRLHVATLMKRMGIEALYRKPNTSKPAPGHKIYPYLLRKLPITRPNQVIDGAMNAEMFELYIETQLGLTLRAGDVIILDNLSSHKSYAAAAALRGIGAWFLFLQPHSPDLVRGSARSGLKAATGSFPGHPSPPWKWHSPS